MSILCLIFAVSYYVLTDGREALASSKWVTIPNHNQQMILQNAPGPISSGLLTPGSSNPAAVKAMAKNLSNKFRVVHNDNSENSIQIPAGGFNRKIGSQIFVPQFGNKGSFNFKGMRNERNIEQDSDNDFFMIPSE